MDNIIKLLEALSRAQQLGLEFTKSSDGGPEITDKGVKCYVWQVGTTDGFGATYFGKVFTEQQAKEIKRVCESSLIDHSFPNNNQIYYSIDVTYLTLEQIEKFIFIRTQELEEDTRSEEDIYNVLNQKK